MSAFNTNAICAVWQRQIGSLLGNPLGYVYMLVFVWSMAGFLYVPDSFFARNIADFGPLQFWMPWLLMVLLPAIAMNSWSLERELGTEEQLMTLPLTVVDALIGKWLGIVTFFTLSLICSGWMVALLCYLGDPDLGLIVANYAGWWLLGITFAAVSLFASTLVSLPAIAFVLGVLFNLLILGTEYITRPYWGEWLDPFNRGLVPTGGIVLFFVITTVFLVLSALVLSSRRWQKLHQAMIVAQSVFVATTALTLINFSVLANRNAIDVDVTTEHLSSLSPATLKLLDGIEKRVRIAAFISKDLPPDLADKGKEVENVLKVLDRELGDKVTLEIRRPADALDEAGSLATKYFDLKPIKKVVETVTGKEEREIFLGVAVTSGANTQRIDYFFPGLSVEYELARTIRTVGSPKRKVVGVVETDMNFMGGFDSGSMQSIPEKQIVLEWKKQYEVRGVNLDAPVGDDIDVLVAPQPSLLEDSKLIRLHDYIWSGRPCLILEDPIPMFSDPTLGTGQPRKQARPNPMMGMQPPPQGPPKADFQPFIKALGIEMDGNRAAWSDYNPSHEFREMMPRQFVWIERAKGGIVTDDPSTTGITSLLMPYPGIVREAPDKNSELKITKLVMAIEGPKFGSHGFDDLMQRNFFTGGMMPKDARELRYIADAGERPCFAVAISGRMARGYPFQKDEKKEDADKDNKDDKDKDKNDKTDDPEKGQGQLSEKPINVIFVADTDMAHDGFFDFLRNDNERFSQDMFSFLQDLRNVQFLANALDSLGGDKDFLVLRNKRPERRPLKVIENVLVKTQEKLREQTEAAMAAAKGKIDNLNNDFQKKLDEIRNKEGVDEQTKKHLVANYEKSARRNLDLEIQEINEETNQQLTEGRIVQKRAIEAEQTTIKWTAFAAPGLLLLVLALSTFGLRVRGERLVIPTSRKRN